jgi:hypothetical protein
MGYMRHHAIVVTSYDVKRIDAAHNEAARLGLDITGILQAAVNEWHTFLVGPDGSKEGWDESDAGDHRRGQFIAWLDGQRFEDGSSPFDWAEVQYGDDERETKVTRHSYEAERRGDED